MMTPNFRKTYVIEILGEHQCWYDFHVVASRKINYHRYLPMENLCFDHMTPTNRQAITLSIDRLTMAFKAGDRLIIHRGDYKKYKTATYIKPAGITDPSRPPR